MSAFTRGAAIFLIGGAFGLAGGFALGIFVYPYIFLADIVATEKVDDQAARKMVARGKFIHANPCDPIHYGKGKVTVYQGLVHLEADFEVGAGTQVPRLPGAGEERDALHQRRPDHVRGPRPAEGLQGQPELPGAGGRGSREVRQRGDLVRAVRGADLARGAQALT